MIDILVFVGATIVIAAIGAAIGMIVKWIFEQF